MSPGFLAGAIGRIKLLFAESGRMVAGKGAGFGGGSGAWFCIYWV